jgi:hypothetical protein
MHFDRTPPVDAFWSLTMYDMPDYYLVDNSIGRYSLGDRTAGLEVDASGSLDVFIQHVPPAADERANWLPAPSGDFRPLIRMYQPRDPVLDETYQLPPIHQVQ